MWGVYLAAPRNGAARKAGAARPQRAGQGSFPFTDFPWRQGRSDAKPAGYNLPGGAPERIKGGEEKVVTRAVACAGMDPRGDPERGYTVLTV